jgi:uncharacterized repeat protein (TIGR03803 family)
MKFQTSSLAIVVLVIWGCSTNSATTSGSLVPAGSVSRDSHGVDLGRIRPPQPDGETPYGGLIKTNGLLWGTTRFGGANGYGAIYSISTTGGYTEVHDFSQSEGQHPLGTLLYKQGYLWGSTYGNGGNFYGTIFRSTLAGGVTLLHDFVGIDGEFTNTRLTKVEGKYFGVATFGGNMGYGTIFAWSQNNGLNPWYEFFGGTDGEYPGPGLTQIGAYLYGTTRQGGAYGQGTIFKISISGAYSKIYDFQGGSVDGAIPYADLTNINGTLYGTTMGGGPGSVGTVFSVTTAGIETMLYGFQGGSDGSDPVAPPILVGADLYGTTESGGTSDFGTIYSIPVGGGPDTVRHSFSGQPADGRLPTAGLLLSGSHVYGTTAYGGTNDLGTVFKYTPGGNEVPIHSF